MPETKQLNVKTVSATVYDRVRELILTGFFAPGQWVREKELIEMLGVSRTPVREALRMLEQERLLVSIPRRGFRVPIPTVKEIRDFFELRAELEGMAAYIAARKADRKKIDIIQKTLEEAEQFLQKEEAFEVIRSNNRFHDAVALASDNQALFQCLQQLRAGVNLHRILSWSTHRERPPITLAQHRKIFEAIKDGNEELAKKRAIEHIQDSLILAVEALEEKRNGQTD